MKKTNDPLVSVCVISYNNAQYLYDSIKSVFEQSYSNIELFVSDDASVDYTVQYGAELCGLSIHSILHEKEKKELKEMRGFLDLKQDDLRKKYEKESSLWVEENRGNYISAVDTLLEEKIKNIRKLKFLKNEENVGTVKHLSKLKKATSGKYIMFLAADDMLHDSNVISDLIDYFENLPEESLVLTSQCGMYCENLQHLYYYAVTDKIKEILNKTSSELLFGELSEWCIVPAAGTIYKREVFSKFGELNEAYHLIEDWSYFLNLAREKCTIYFCDRLTYKHRDGGISHGNTSNGTLGYKHYLNDTIKIFENEILPYHSQITPEQKKRSKKKYREACREYHKNFVFPEEGILKKIVFLLKNAEYYAPKIILGFLDFFEYRAKWSLVMGISLLFCNFCYSLSSSSILDFVSFDTRIFGVLGLFITVLTMSLYSLSKLIKNLDRLSQMVKRRW